AERRLRRNQENVRPGIELGDGPGTRRQKEQSETGEAHYFLSRKTAYSVPGKPRRTLLGQKSTRTTTSPPRRQASVVKSPRRSPLQRSGSREYSLPLSMSLASTQITPTWR